MVTAETVFRYFSMKTWSALSLSGALILGCASSSASGKLKVISSEQTNSESRHNSMSDGKPINAMKSDVVDVSKQLAQGRVSNIDLALIDSWSDERNVRDVIEAYEYEPDIVVQLYFKPINKEKGVWEHYPTSKHKGDVHVLLHSNVSFFSAHLETDILNALDEAKITKSSIHAESRHVKFLLPDFGETTYIRPQREDGIIKLSFKLLEYGDVVEGSVKFRKNAPYNLLSIGGN